MKNLKFMLHTAAACAMAAVTVACSSDDETNNNTALTSETVTLTAYQPGSEPSTRLGFDSKGNAYWQTSDAIGVWSNGENKFKSFALKTGAGEATATFSGEVTGGVGSYAVYPYNENHSISDNTLNYYLPASYTYTKVGQTVLTDKDGNNFLMPMLGTVANGEVTFKHIGGIVCIKIDKMPAESGTVKAYSTLYIHQGKSVSSRMCGSFTASLTDGTPEIKTTSYENIEGDDKENSVIFNYSGAEKGKPGVFYLPLATGQYYLNVIVTGGGRTSAAYSFLKTVERAKAYVVNVITDYSCKINNQSFVDLGLPSGLLWAENNIGASSSTDAGDYYAWGETETKDNYTWAKYTLWDTTNNTVTAYNNTDNKTVLATTHDAAYQNWGSSCRMPTATEFQELIDNCTWTYETDKGYTVKSKKNDRSIFLPLTGLKENETVGNPDTGYYWSSTRSSECNYAYILGFRSSLIEVQSNGVLRDEGCAIRPVADL